MRVRRLITEHKTQESDTGWRYDDMRPRFAPVFVRTRPIRAGWRWRSAQADSAERQYILTALCNASRDNWQAMLILCDQEGLRRSVATSTMGRTPACTGMLTASEAGLNLAR